MVKRIQCFLTDSEAFEMEKAKEKLEAASDYSFVKLAISELCERCNGHDGEAIEVSGKKGSSHPSLKEYLEKARYVCANCRFPLVRVDEITCCPMCGSTKYKEV